MGRSDSFSEHMKPVITVLMSVYNGECFLRKAVESILKQTFTDFEFIIIDDGSTDASPAILAEYAAQDARIRLVLNDQNIGLTRSLNKGLALAQGKYIARMDLDDISEPERFGKQVETLETKGADVGFCRSVFVKEANGEERLWKEADWSLIRWRGLFANRYGLHSAVMFRKQPILELGGYDESFPRSQDYELWDRCATSGLRFVYTPESLLRYLLRSQGISRQHPAEQEEYARRVSFRAMYRLLPDAKDVELQGLRWLFLRREPPVSNDCVQAGLNRCFDLVKAFLFNGIVGHGRTVWEDVAMSLAWRLRDIKGRKCLGAVSLLSQALIRSCSLRSLARVLRVSFSAKTN